MLISALIGLLAGPVFAGERLPAGTVLEPVHMSGDPGDVSYFVGREVKRTIYPGKQIAFTDTKEADLVQRNSLVRIIARKGPLRLETQGRALGAGTEGMVIRVMNLESKRTIMATIVGENTVEVEL